MHALAAPRESAAKRPFGCNSPGPGSLRSQESHCEGILYVGQEWTDEDRVDLRFFFNAAPEVGLGVGSNWTVQAERIAGLNVPAALDGEEGMIARLEAVDRLRRVAGVLQGIAPEHAEVLGAAFREGDFQAVMPKRMATRYNELAGVMAHKRSRPITEARAEALASKALARLDKAKEAYLLAKDKS